MRFALLLAVSAALVLAGHAIPQNQPEQWWPDDEYDGWSDCQNGKPIAWINTRVIGTADEAITVAHEKKHNEQARRFPSCDAYNSWMAEHTDSAEAEAFCVEVAFDLRHTTPDTAHIRAAINMAVAYPELGLSVEQADTMIRHFCPSP